MEKLAKEIATFMWHVDLYEAHDAYDSFEEFITEIIRGLYNPIYRKVLALTLKEIVEWGGIEEEASEAATLYRKVVTL